MTQKEWVAVTKDAKSHGNLQATRAAMQERRTMGDVGHVTPRLSGRLNTHLSDTAIKVSPFAIYDNNGIS